SALARIRTTLSKALPAELLVARGAVLGHLPDLDVDLGMILLLCGLGCLLRMLPQVVRELVELLSLRVFLAGLPGYLGDRVRRLGDLPVVLSLQLTLYPLQVGRLHRRLQILVILFHQRRQTILPVLVHLAERQ